MKVVRNRADAWWLPTRFRFAVFRLFAYLRLGRMAAVERPGLVLPIDRDQSGTDHYAFAALLGVMTVSYTSAGLMTFMPAVLAVPVALVITGFLAQIPMWALGVSLTMIGRVFGAPGENHLRIQDFVLTSLLVASAAWAALSHSWLRFVGWGCLAVVAINAAAAVIAFPLRKRMAAMEDRFDVEVETF